MGNDLISREWLKDAFDNLCCHDCKKCRNFRKEDSFFKCDLIDNAPTVEQPQGEWEEINERIGIGEDNIYTSFKCPFCGYIDLLDNNYCGNCGAKMKKD